MAVVDREKHQVLVVPTESSILHANVEPRHVYAAYVLFSGKLHETVDCVGEIVQVPGMVLVGSLVGMNNLLTFPTEAGAERRRRDISCILNLNDRFNLLVNHLPVFTFHIVVVIRKFFILCIFKLERKHLKLLESHSFFVLVKRSRLG